jgi:hypothetical protein
MQREGGLTLTMRPGAYRLGEEERLARSAERLAALLWVDYRRTFAPRSEVEQGRDLDQREFYRRRALLEAEGSSGYGGVTLATVGLSSWRAEIGWDYFGGRTEAQVVAALREAAEAVFRDYERRLLRLKDECFDLELPRDRRQA